MMNARQATIETLLDLFIKKQSLQKTIPFYKKQIPQTDQALFQALIYGALREWQSISVLRNQLLKSPINDNKAVLGIILNIGIYQLLRMSLGDHGVLNETVNLCPHYKIKAMKPVVNAILRRTQRDKEMLVKQLDNTLSANLPPWITRIYKDKVALLSKIYHEHPPMTLRIRQPSTPENWLAEHQIKGRVNKLHPQAVTLTTPMPVENIPGFTEGSISVQDAAAQWPASLLDVKDKSLHILDACAAPGGKTGHLKELSPSSSVIAIDHDEKRLDKVKDNLQRLNVQAQCISADASNINEWWDKQLFDRILLDAPCSGSGIIHRHPDIPYLRNEKDFIQFSKIQFKLLNTLWQTLKKDGLLLYTTCSILPRENQFLIEQFVKTEASASVEVLTLPFCDNSKFGSVHLPDYNGDGFFYALLRKK